jgi:hypothetical protein
VIIILKLEWLYFTNNLSISLVIVKKVYSKLIKTMVVSIVLNVQRIVLIVKKLEHVKSVMQTNSYLEMTLIKMKPTNVLILVIKASYNKLVKQIHQKLLLSMNIHSYKKVFLNQKLVSVLNVDQVVNIVLHSGLWDKMEPLVLNTVKIL